MTKTAKGGLFSFLERRRLDRLSPRQLADIIPDGDPRTRNRVSHDQFGNTLVDFLLFGGPTSR